VLGISGILRVDIAVDDIDDAIDFYTQQLGFTVAVDAPFGEGKRWVEVRPPGSEATIALVEPSAALAAGRFSGVVLRSSDPRADHARLQASNVVVSDLIGGSGGIPCLFFLRDPSGNQLMVNDGQ
jgi:catechol 2,3-dioxygenase-like lactoylglutathione lyase family enzyme